MERFPFLLSKIEVLVKYLNSKSLHMFILFEVTALNVASVGVHTVIDVKKKAVTLLSKVVGDLCLCCLTCGTEGLLQVTSYTGCMKMIGAVLKLIIFKSMVNRIINTGRNERVTQQVYDTYLQMFDVCTLRHTAHIEAIVQFRAGHVRGLHGPPI